MKFTTGYLNYVSSRSLVKTSDRVTFSDGRLAVEGTGLELMLKTKSVRVLNNVTANIRTRAK